MGGDGAHLAHADRAEVGRAQLGAFATRRLSTRAQGTLDDNLKLQRTYPIPTRTAKECRERCRDLEACLSFVWSAASGCTLLKTGFLGVGAANLSYTSGLCASLNERGARALPSPVASSCCLRLCGARQGRKVKRLHTAVRRAGARRVRASSSAGALALRAQTL